MHPDRFCCQWEFLQHIILQSFSGLQLLALQMREMHREEHSENFFGAPSLRSGGSSAKGEVLDKDDEPISQQEPMPPFPEIGAVINKALRAAGLIKG